MTEIMLERASIVAIVGELVAAGVPQHVGVNRKLETSRNTKPLDQLPEAARGERRAAL